MAARGNQHKGRGGKPLRTASDHLSKFAGGIRYKGRKPPGNLVLPGAPSQRIMERAESPEQTLARHNGKLSSVERQLEIKQRELQRAQATPSFPEARKKILATSIGTLQEQQERLKGLIRKLTGK